MLRTSAFFLLLISFIVTPAALAAEDSTSFDEATAGLSAHAGLFTLYSDTDQARVLMALPAADDDGLIARVIYAEYLRSGLGSNPVGLDRAQSASSQVVAFRRVGQKVYAEVENTTYVADTDNALERDAVRQSFATSIIWSGKVEAEADDGRMLVDISSFLLRDAHAIGARLAARGQGAFKQSKDLSFVDPMAVWAFPENVDMESVLTFEGSKPGSEVRAIVPEPRAVTLRMHHSFIALPDDGYQVREADPRSGAISIPVFDYAAGLDEPIIKHYAVRHRLIKKDPDAAVSEPVEPIIYYVDPGAPEPVKSALIEGGNWWADAFEAAGFKNAYRVEELPEGAHPLDVRYNMINWVHRQTRGWSYGASIRDPRTGEILKGHVLLGSLRVRQDRMIFEGLVGADKTGTGGPNDPLTAALARIRQLSAHEIGHTIGFQHNMAASTNDRASVMDYPAPKFGLNEDGSIDLSEAYAVGMGAWDYVTVKWLYRQAAPGQDEQAMLDQVLADARAAGLNNVSDGHSRPVGAAHPLGNVWDNGANAIDELEHLLRVRRVALDKFGKSALAEGQPAHLLQQVIVPIYLLHRYQIPAAAKSIGGIYYQYGVNGHDYDAVTPAGADEQSRAMAALMASVQPEALDLSNYVLSLLLAAPYGFDPQANREIFKSPAHPSFSLMEAADVAADAAMSAVFHPQRLSRLAEWHARDESLPSVTEIAEQAIAAVLDGPRRESARHQALRDVVKARLVSELIDVSTGTPIAGPNIPGFSQNRGREALNAAALAEVEAVLVRLRERLLRSRGNDMNRLLADKIKDHLERPAGAVMPQMGGAAIPPGSPIGAAGASGEGTAETCWMCDFDFGR